MNRIEMLKAKIAAATMTTNTSITLTPMQIRASIVAEFRSIGWTYINAKGYEVPLTFTLRDGSIRRTKEWFDLVNEDVKTLKQELAAEGIRIAIPSIVKIGETFAFPDHPTLNDVLNDIITAADVDFEKYCRTMYDVDKFIRLADEYTETFGQKGEIVASKVDDVRAKIAALRAKK